MSLQFAISTRQDIRSVPILRAEFQLPAEVQRAARAGLPLVVGDGYTFTEWSFANPASRTLAFIADASAEHRYRAGTTALDLAAARTYFPWSIYSWSEFASQHRSFLVYRSLGQNDWLVPTILERGGNVQLLSATRSAYLYRVELTR
jgi:hypothetical protein